MKEKIILVAILSLALLFRFWRLDKYPALNADEAAIGYNAYSLIQTGKDEHGNPWPIHFQSFNDYKPGFYIYLVLPFVKAFGLNEWAVRVPNALLGVATVFLIYLLIKKLFKNETFAITSSFFLAISPWHIHFSRGGWEVNTAAFFIVLGMLLFVIAKNNLSILMLSTLSFALSLYTYHSARVVVPLLIFGTAFTYRKKILANISAYLLAALIGLVALLPLIKEFTKPEISSRASGVGIFSDAGTLARINEQRGEHDDLTGIFPKLLHNKPVNYTLAFLENWSKHFGGEFLFLNGDVIQRNKVPETGQMYLFDTLFLAIGFVGVARELLKLRNKHASGWKLILWWLVVAPVAAALTFQSPHALRSQIMVIPLVIISAYGVVKIVEFIGKQGSKIRYFGFLTLAILVVWNFTRYEHMYFIHMAKEYPFSSQYGVKELVSYINENQYKFDNIVVTNRYDQPYILFLFYTKYPPEKFQNDHVLTARDQYGFSTVAKFANYQFKSIDFNKDVADFDNSMIVGTDDEIPDNSHIIKEIYGTNGYKYFQIVAN